MKILESAYLSLQEIIAQLDREADNAVFNEDYDDASLLASQSDKLYQTAEELELVITEQEQLK
jgi:hypothetical protein